MPPAWGEFTVSRGTKLEIPPAVIKEISHLSFRKDPVGLPSPTPSNILMHLHNSFSHGDPVIWSARIRETSAVILERSLWVSMCFPKTSAHRSRFLSSGVVPLSAGHLSMLTIDYVLITWCLDAADTSLGEKETQPLSSELTSYLCRQRKTKYVS